jgi:hypothetical protein
VACPVNALELVVDDPATAKKTYKVQGGKSITFGLVHEIASS